MCNTIEILILDYQNPELSPQEVDSKGKLDGLNDHKYGSCSTRSSIILFVIRLSFMSRRSLIISLIFSLFLPNRCLVLPNMSCMITFDVVPLERRAFKKFVREFLLLMTIDRHSMEEKNRREGLKKVEISFCVHDQDGMGQGSGGLKQEYPFFCRLPFSQIMMGPIAISFSQPSVTLEICVQKRLLTVSIDINK